MLIEQKAKLFEDILKTLGRGGDVGVEAIGLRFNGLELFSTVVSDAFHLAAIEVLAMAENHIESYGAGPGGDPIGPNPYQEVIWAQGGIQSYA